ncbi:MAG: hypothetical protein WC121_02715 [Candidatus Kapaibacterium sp.]
MIKYNTIILIIIALFLSSCDKGLEPPEAVQPATLNINIDFINDWPKRDSIYGLRVVAFKLPPSDNLISEILSGNAQYKDLNNEYNVNYKNIQFTYEELPIELKYIVVAWQYDSLITEQRAIGVYNNSNKNEPSSIKLINSDTVNINIEVDWNDFPPQPF